MEANPDLSSLSTLELESSITRLCANLNAATYRQLMMIAEFDRRQGWGHDGVRSCAHWLNWRCGISLVTARENIRVAHALTKLPKTCEAFSTGVLSYSKARAITRVGTVHNEDTLLSFARYGTASQLDKTVRLYRQQYNHAGQLMEDYQQPVLPADSDSGTEGTSTDAERWDAENQGAMHNRQYRQLTTQWDEHGCLEIKARLTAEQGALVIKAIEAAIESIKACESSDENESAESAELAHAQNAPAGASQASTDYNQRVERFKAANEHATRRRSDALVLMAEAFLRDTKVASCTDDRYQVVVHVDSNVLAKKDFESTSGKPDCYIEKQVALPVETARRLSCSCKIVTALTREGEPLNIGRSSRAIPTGIRRAMTIRDGACSFPGCDCQQHLQAHHLHHWANGGETSLTNLTSVCHFHHTLLHEGQYSVERLLDGTLQFKRPDGSVINQTGVDLVDKWEPRSTIETSCITPIIVPTTTPTTTETPIPTIIIPSPNVPATNNEPWSWCGESMDYDTALYNIACHDRRAAADRPSES